MTPLRHTDWLFHNLDIQGPAEPLAAFARAATGSGAIAWHLDLDQAEEDWFHRLAAQPDGLGAPGARILAGQLRERVARRSAQATARIGHSTACPFDLNALVPIPDPILRRGPDAPETRDWLWQNWGTPHPLRHVSRAPHPENLRLSFWSADWSPWRALATIAAAWPSLSFHLRPSYDPR